MLRTILAIAKEVRPLVQREWVSLAKVEKVVNPPRKPVARSGKTQGGVFRVAK